MEISFSLAFIYISTFVIYLPWWSLIIVQIIGITCYYSLAPIIISLSYYFYGRFSFSYFPLYITQTSQFRKICNYCIKIKRVIWKLLLVWWLHFPPFQIYCCQHGSVWRYIRRWSGPFFLQSSDRRSKKVTAAQFLTGRMIAEERMEQRYGKCKLETWTTKKGRWSYWRDAESNGETPPEDHPIDDGNAQAGNSSSSTTSSRSKLCDARVEHKIRLPTPNSLPKL